MADENGNSENDLKQKFSPSFDNEGIPASLEWSAEDVAEWIEYLGFPQYKVSLHVLFLVVCNNVKDQKIFLIFKFVFIVLNSAVSRIIS